MIKIVLALLIVASTIHATPALGKRVLEDTFILFALDSQRRQKPEQASEFFAELYKKTSKIEYLYESLRMLEHSGDTTYLSKKVDESLALFPEDETLKQFEIIVLLRKGKFSEASDKAADLSGKTKKTTDYILYAEARLKLADYAGTVSILTKAYNQEYDERTAERIALIRYAHLNQKKEAIAFLKEHIGAHGNSGLIGKRLGSLYADSGALKEAAQMYEETYELTNDPDIAKEAAKIYFHLQEYPKLVVLLEKSGANDPMLLEMYVKEKAFAKASALAQKLYEANEDPSYLAQSVIFRYEGAANKQDKAMITGVVDGLKQAAAMIDDPLTLNYLGYLMIDHDMNVTEGMGYVRRALEKQPDSPFYLDSLAWGNYKIGECAEAQRLIKQVESMIGTDEPEVQDHIKAIKACKTKEKR